MVDRKKEFNNIRTALTEKVFFSDDKTLLFNNDSINILKKIPDHSISLILTDPPYHSTKNLI